MLRLGVSSRKRQEHQEKGGEGQEGRALQLREGTAAQVGRREGTSSKEAK